MAKNSMLKSVSIVSGITIISRVLGYLRDAILFSLFGISSVGAAFLLAFRLPNLFRRLLGEGALSSAMIPILSSQYVAHGKASMFELFSHVIRRLVIVLCCVLLLVYGVVFFAKGKVASDKWTMALSFTSVLLPYMVFVCLSAVCAAALNVLGMFAVGSLSQIWLNISMIVSLLVGGFYFHFGDVALANCLIAGVLIGGLLQLVIPLLALAAIGWRPTFGSSANLKQNMHDVWRLFFPGAFGAAMEQINILISSGIAYNFMESAVSSLHMASRLIELPMGIFGTAIATVFAPNMAKIVASENSETAAKIFNACLMAMVWILLPSAVGLFLLRHEILHLLFAHGKFSEANVGRVAPIVAIYCVSMVFSGASALFIRGFHSLRDTKTPVVVGFSALLINALLAATVMRLFGVVGLATVTACSTVLQSLCLFFLFKRRVKLSILPERKNYATILCGCIAVAIVVMAVKFSIESFSPFGQRMTEMIVVALSAGLSLLVYFVLCKKLVAAVLGERKKV
ncbi:MAG: murein biosynthesis integral membrane protein MurJ [Puniceicoccales bacterium]|jgi:putative peptidoglycan lipid II flippase|nr:murein biosynthesis integral membrane protein MurJ [Puniceicoccales bacterium]